ncbi:hypothetical protein Q3O43_01630 [Rhodococcus aetherivorans]|uniref:DUF2231 domain-containing protein n=1 Tax=Rhodococcus aetherivorans TaxID=191292 RepID=UPI0026F00A8B|nr:DUF2231 domain-containing protein [Rhodococcus aetherivorans]WKW99059.1 hypothetical protein Q3O43_01630 [Rhodococcus aetherivorans]
MTLIGGLPAHPLLVHAVVVLVPLVSTGLILCALWPAARRHLLWPVVVLAAAALVLTPLTAETGEQLAGALGDTPLIEAHKELGETMTLVVALLFAATALLAGAHMLRGRGDGGGRRALTVVAAVLAVVAAVGATVQTVRVGESGAEAVWTGRVPPATAD